MKLSDIINLLITNELLIEIENEYVKSIDMTDINSYDEYMIEKITSIDYRLIIIKLIRKE